MLRNFLLKIQRGDGWFYAGLKRSIKAVYGASLTPPEFLKGPLFGVYTLHFLLKDIPRILINFFYRGPVFKARCAKVGRNLSITTMPHIIGPVVIEIGDDVEMFGHLGVTSGRIFDRPLLVIGDRVDIGHNVQFTVNKEVVIEEECNIAYGVRIVDSDAHPRNTEGRVNGLPPPPEEIKAVRICKRAWLSAGCLVMKGVTVGEGAVVGAGSVVVADVPPYAVVMGNPARVVVKDLRAAAQPAAAQPAAGPN